MLPRDAPRSRPEDTLSGGVAQGIRDLRPDSYALVMATGIIALATSQAGMARMSWGLFQITKTAYAVLWLLTLARLTFYRRRMTEDLTSHTPGVGFLTVVAATCVLGSQFVILSGDRGTAFFLWMLGAVLWLILGYTFFAVATVRAPKPALAHYLDGSWLMAVVATQSVSLLGTLVAPEWGSLQRLGLFLTLAIFLLGCMLYVPIIVVILYRLLFLPVAPADLTPPYWISMGALAISALAGGLLVGAASHSAMLHEMVPVLMALTLSLWTLGTWWIPLLIILGVWRHIAGRVPLTYDPEYWAMVFPLGMYTACTFELAQITGLAFLRGVAHGFIYVALAAWLWAFVGLLRSLVAPVLVLAQRRY